MISYEKMDKKISFVLVFLLCILLVNYTFKDLFNIVNPMIRGLISLFFMSIVGILYLANLSLVLKRIGNYFLLTYIFFITIFLMNLLIFPEIKQYLPETLFWFFIICLPTALYYLAIQDKKIFLEMLLKSAYLQLLIGLFFIVSFFIRGTGNVYDMVFSYHISIPVILLLYKFFRERSVLDLILVVLGVLSILMIGSRGPLLSIIVFILLSILFQTYGRRKEGKSILFSLLIGVLISFGLLYLDKIIIMLERIFTSLGVDSRTLRIFTNDNIDFSTGRGPIYDATKEKILENPLWGHGILGDREFLNGTYPHNLFLELLAQFGIILGSILIIIFFVYTFLSFINKYKAERDLALLFFSIGVVQLFVSNTFWMSYNFWLFLAVCISSVHLPKRYKERESY
ncbi:O-antigen ligase like membrane protein [Bhargavaea beijingensis]|uniref:O-antigen ligase like membrane protein n=1 Tax=Bhargavaea beijingensis TaxID=426756 RepID=A0A1G6Z9S0_9BACL|nr:O-antigen ligase family protein [Bhargavaea beijingensis]SDD99350.1 O-antigen ligase like membrane protein [Bhargavaea beijingensis]